METICPRSPEELAHALGDASRARKIIRVEGNNSKQRAGGPIPDAGAVVSTLGLDQVIEYEPRDLTISVGAGMLYARFTELLDADGMMVPLDPPFASQATVGGVVSANSSGSRRRLYGTARDLVIGMHFVTLEGKLIQSGGMVVKNVAGLDMAKMMIGSLGTLAVIATVNFKLIPKALGTRSFLYEFASIREAIETRDRILQGVLTAVAVDLLNPAAAAALGRQGWLLGIGTAGNRAVLDRYKRELPRAEVLEGDEERRFWGAIQEFPAEFLRSNPAGCIVRVVCPLASVESCAGRLPGAVIVRAANGVCYACVADEELAARALSGNRGLIEYGSEGRGQSANLWPNPEPGFPIMQNVKKMFDPNNLLNPGRFYGRL